MSKIARSKAVLPPLTDELIESGADLSGYLQNVRPVPALTEPQKVNVDFPAWVVGALDREADRIGVPRQSLIKVWIVERLERGAVSASELRSLAKRTAIAEKMRMQPVKRRHARPVPRR